MLNPAETVLGAAECEDREIEPCHASTCQRRRGDGHCRQGDRDPDACGLTTALRRVVSQVEDACAEPDPRAAGHREEQHDEAGATAPA